MLANVTDCGHAISIVFTKKKKKKKKNQSLCEFFKNILRIHHVYVAI